MRGRIACCVALWGGCAFGGGPVVGVGLRHGWFAGAELGGGMELGPQAVAGYETRGNRVYVRGDAVVEVAASNNDSAIIPGARLGGGYAWSLSDEPSSGMFLAALSAGTAVGTFHAGCGDWNQTMIVTLDVRYVGEWQIAASPRYELGSVFCFGPFS